MDNRQVGQSSQTTSSDIGARDPTADNSEKNKTIDDMGKLRNSSPFDGDEGAPQGPTTTDEVLIIVRNAHSDEPDVHHKESGHSPKYRVDGAATISLGFLASPAIIAICSPSQCLAFWNRVTANVVAITHFHQS